MNNMIKLLKPEEINHLRELFEEIDTGKTGIITANELQNALRKAKFSLSTQQVTEIIKEIDY